VQGKPGKRRAVKNGIAAERIRAWLLPVMQGRDAAPTGDPANESLRKDLLAADPAARYFVECNATRRARHRSAPRAVFRRTVR